MASTEDLDLLPRPGDRFDVDTDVATGYAQDLTTTSDVNEGLNAARTNQPIGSGATPPR